MDFGPGPFGLPSSGAVLYGKERKERTYEKRIVQGL